MRANQRRAEVNKQNEFQEKFKILLHVEKQKEKGRGITEKGRN